MGATILFMDDLIDSFQTDVTITSSTTEAGSGYHAENVRDPGLGTMWKGTDHVSNDVWLQIDKSNTTWLGGLGAQAFVALSYDSRNNEQDRIDIITDDADNPAMTVTSVAASFTLVKNGSRVVHAYSAISNPAKRYWRLLMPGNARSEASGTKVPRIYRWSFFRPTGLIDVDGSFSSNTPAPGDYDVVSKVARMTTGGGLPYTNSIGSVDQEFDLGFIPADTALWTALRDKFIGIGNDLKSFFILYDGVKSDGTANFTLARLSTERWSARRPRRDQYETAIRIVQEPWT